MFVEVINISLLIKIIVILILSVILIISGCIDDDIEPVNTNSTVELITYPQLEIMSVTAQDGNIIIKVKNVGNGTAKDVYVGIIGITDNSFLSWLKPKYGKYIDDLVYDTMINGDSYVISDTPLYISNDSEYAVIFSEFVSREYIGDIMPNNVSESKHDIISYKYDKYVKIAWTKDYAEYVVY